VQITLVGTQVQQAMAGKVEKEDGFRPSSRHFTASSTPAAMAWADSGAGELDGDRKHLVRSCEKWLAALFLRQYPDKSSSFLK